MFFKVLENSITALGAGMIVYGVYTAGLTLWPIATRMFGG